MYDFLTHTIFFAIPFLLMVAMYAIIIYEIMKQVRIKSNRSRVKRTIKVIITTTLITVGFFVTWSPYYITVTEKLFFNIYKKGFTGIVVMFYFNLWWDSIIYSLRTPLIHKLTRKSIYRILQVSHLTNSSSSKQSNPPNAVRSPISKRTFCETASMEIAALKFQVADLTVSKEKLSDMSKLANSVNLSGINNA